MRDADFLFIVSEVAVGFAGFASIVAAIGRQNTRDVFVSRRISHLEHHQHRLNGFVPPAREGRIGPWGHDFRRTVSARERKLSFFSGSCDSSNPRAGGSNPARRAIDSA